MKKFIIFIILFICCKYSISQETEKIDQPSTRADFLQKSKSQKTGAWILLGAGIASFALVAPGNTSFGTTGAVVVLGGLSILSSIPLFIASGRNKRKAANASAFFNIEKVNDDPLALHRINYKPTLSVKISF